MKPEQYEESAQRVIDDDDAAGVALLMADHTRCLEQLRAIYDEAAPRQVADRGAEAVVATVRDLALNGLKMPDDLRQRLVASGRPALTEGDRIEFDADHEHTWQQATGHVAVHAVPEQSVMHQPLLGDVDLEAPALAELELVRHLARRRTGVVGRGRPRDRQPRPADEQRVGDRLDAAELMGGQADLAPMQRAREQDRYREEQKRVPKRWRWSLTLRVERTERDSDFHPPGHREVSVDGEIMAPTHNGHAFGTTALRRAMHDAGAAVAKKIRALDRA